MTALEALFAPRRVAVLGVSRNPAKLGHVLLKNMLEGGFGGEVLVVNPAGAPILGRPSLPDAGALPEDIDLALISLPPEAVLAAVKGLAERRARVAVILTSGFGEVDARGRVEEAAVLEAALSGGLRLIGPNCMGVYSRPADLNGTYFWDLPRLPGGVGVISQSGAYGGLIMRHLGSLGLGVSRFLSIGNQVDLEIADVLDFLATDAATTVVACFVESVKGGRRFVEAARRVTACKPMVVLKAGRTEAGRRAAGSHTGSLAGAAEVYQAAFRHAGLVACADTEEFLDAIQALATSPRRPAQPTLAVVTVSGGPSVIAADAAESAGIAVPAMPPATQTALRRLLPSFAAVGNPVDLTPQVDPRQITEAAGLVLGEPGIAGALAVNVGLDIAEFADGLLGAARSAGKPLLACAVDAPTVARKFRDAAVAVYSTPERAVRAYRALWIAGQGPLALPEPGAAPVIAPEIDVLLRSGTGALSYQAARDLLQAYGVRFCRDRLVGSVEAAVDAAAALGYPVVIKTARTDVPHKTEGGGVVANICRPDDVRKACGAILDRLGAGLLLVQEQIPAGTELLLGGRRDEIFGPVVLVGTGGFLAEAIRDVSLALAPLDGDLAEALVGEGLRRRLVLGYRGLPPWEPHTVGSALCAIGRLLGEHPRVREVDVNPLIARGAEAVAVDALVLVGE
jgi:acetyltransferase